VTATTATPFIIHVEQERLDDLHTRLERVRWPGDCANDDWSYGVPEGVRRDLVAYWRTDFDWRVQEAAMNRYAHRRATVDGVPVHFLHAPGRGPAPLPLVLTHGWPWTFWDFAKVIGPLADPGAHGGDPADAFDVVVPSLPGFGFSSPLREAGLTYGRVADLWDRVMRDVLGFPRYAAHGGDWGAWVTAVIGHRFADHVAGVHESIALLPGFDYRTLRAEDYAPDEAEWIEHTRRMRGRIVSHLTVHRRDAQTLAYALQDSPVGLLAWMLARRRAWSDCDGDVFRTFTRDELLTTASLYWLTDTVATSLRFYADDARYPWTPSHDRRPMIEAPAGFAIFPKDVVLVPRAVVSRHANVRRWTVMPRGGHFAPAEEPELLVDDLRAFFRDLR
jgi:pimeloyl-ACP methyl ester carboxylesterase